MHPKTTTLLNDPNWLREAYETKSLAMIAAELGCSITPIRNSFIRYGIQRRPKRFPHRAAHPRPLSDSERFWRKVEKSDGCWNWTAGKNRGYGQFWIGRRSIPAQRFAWEITNGPIPDGMLVCHHCDNPSCVRPDHLFLGTGLDNMQDKVAKGRHRFHAGVPRPSATGERNHNARFTDAEVAEMRTLYASGEWSQRQLAARFNTKQPVIQRIVTGKSRVPRSH